MKKLGIFIIAALALSSCNRDVEVQSADNASRISIRTAGEISGELHAMDETVTVNAKNAVAPISYGYKAFAEGPKDLKFTDDRYDPSNSNWQGISQLAQATAVFAVDDFLFVTWHLEDEVYGGAVSAYKFDSNTDTYTYMEIAEFEDTDFHELYVTKNSLTGFYELFLVGQRAPNSSNYLLSGHKGAIVGKLLFNYVTGQFDAGTYKELPLPGHGANDIHAYNGEYFIVTGNGQGGGFAGGGIYKTDYNLTNVSDYDELSDGMILEYKPSGFDPDAIGVLNRSGNNIEYYEVQGMNVSFGLNGNMPSVTATIPGSASTTDLDRFGACYVEQYDPFFGGSNGEYDLLVSIGGGGLHQIDGSTVNPIQGRGSFATFSVTYDANSKIVYTAEGEAGVSMLAAPGYPGGPLVSDYDVLAAFIPPTTQPAAWSNGFNVKDVAVYSGNYLSIAVGGTDGAGSPSKGGVYFVKKNN